jgi:putative Mg2+ transporter-C (MgtC) family protein
MITLDTGEISLRIGLALATGLVLGMEREQHGRAAGLRTTMLVCVAAAIAMILSEFLFLESSRGSDAWRPDPARLAAGILAGMGFLGAGVIMRQENAIHGVTTAAVLWFSAILGMAFGSGFFGLGFIGFSIAVIALFILPKAEAYILSDRYGQLSVSCALKGGPSRDRVVELIQGLGLKAQAKPAGFEVDLEKRRIHMQFDIKIKNSRLGQCQLKAVEALSKLKGVRQVQWR